MVKRTALALTLILLAWCSNAFALDPTLDISQYAHKAWKIREGFIDGVITSMAQTPDGYLWLGTELGLFRFDGVRNLLWKAPAGESLPNSYIRSLLAARDGTLWIGTLEGLSSWKDGKLTSHSQLAGFLVDALLEDRQGTIWAGGQTMPYGRLCAIDSNGSAACHGDDGIFGRFVESIYEDRQGNLWVGSQRGLWHWKPEPMRRLATQETTPGPQSLLEDEHGSLMMRTESGVTRLIDGKFVKSSVRGNREPVRVARIFRDRDGALWFGTLGSGLLHIHKGRTDTFLSLDGLSGDTVSALFEDREGNVWVATSGGLDRFRNSAVATISTKQGLSSDTILAVLAARDGSTWLTTRDGLNIINDGGISHQAGTKRDDLISSLFQDDDGRIWGTRIVGLVYESNNRFATVPGFPGGQVRDIAEDSQGNLWTSNLDRGLLRLSPAYKVQIFPWTTLGHDDYATALFSDRSGKGLWLGFYKGGILYFADGRVRAAYTVTEGLGKGRVGGLQLDRDGTLWAATQGGLSRLKDGMVATLTSKDGLPCDGVHWSSEDDNHFFWLYMTCGLVRIARADLEAWATPGKSLNGAVRRIPYTLFDASDGVQNTANPSGSSPVVSKSSDGSLWFINGGSVSRVDTRHIPYNSMPPPVHVEQIVADRQTYDVLGATATELRLPPRTRDVVIEYTALNLGAPEKTHFRYKLENRDRDWQDVGNRRYASYGDLSPSNYRFRVAAANESGVWNEAGTFVDFSVEPAYYQTTWFRFAMVAAFLTMLAALYRLRLRHLTRQYNIRLEERVSERTRIARELHDTLLQSFQGALLKFYAVGYQLPDGSEAKQSLDSVIEQVRGAIAEGRDALQGLRTSKLSSNDLAETMSVLGKAIGDQIGQSDPDFRVQMEGAPRRLAPLVLDEIYQFANEALRNAFQHANAKRIEVEILFDSHEFRLRIRDDGKGIDPEVLREGGRPGHYGLTGMHERAKQAGGKVDVWSEVNSGTEVELTIPGKIAYTKSPARRWAKS